MKKAMIVVCSVVLIVLAGCKMGSLASESSECTCITTVNGNGYENYQIKTNKIPTKGISCSSANGTYTSNKMTITVSCK